MKFVVKRTLSLGVLALGVLACTKQIPYQAQFKEEVLEKTIDTNTDYLMSSSMLNASRSSVDALPYSAGDTKRVRMEWSEKSLRVIEMDRDLRFQSNSTNNKLVMEIPVTHVDYQCAKDKYGDCTNTEEENTKVSWNQKKSFKIQPEATKSARLEILPILQDSAMSGGFCYNEVSSRVVNFKLEKDAMNMSIERTFNVSPFCTELNDLSDTTVSAVFHYSFVKTSSVLTPGFKIKNYPILDANKFGFFSTSRIDLGVDNNASLNGISSIMNHWDPRRDKIEYFLSDNFYKPEYKSILESTKQVFDSINLGLKNSGAKFQLTLNSTQGKSPGDIRNSMIVMVEDPVASSVIGYGPQTEDPKTGEIISARTIMFLGTIKSYIKSTYDDIIRHKREEKLKVLKSVLGGDAALLPGVNLKEVVPQLFSETLNTSGQFPSVGGGVLKKMTSIHRSSADSVLVGPVKIEKPRFSRASSENKISPQVLLIKEQAEQIAKNSRNTKVANQSPAEHLKYLKEQKNCAYSFENESLGSLSEEMLKLIPDDAPYWVDLTESERQKYIDILLPRVWVPTLIHEMGHNLGLRHNFKGSEDVDNFYSQKELKVAKIDQEIPSSSVMEYIDDLRALPILGKYDIAALRFAYAGKVESQSGEIVSVEGTLKDTINQQLLKNPHFKLKNFKYCSDETADQGVGCRRFDLGVSMTEVAMNYISAYRNRYSVANLRAGAIDFSEFQSGGYLQRSVRSLMRLRNFQELYSLYLGSYPLESEEWKNDEFLKDLKTAANLASKFLVEVLSTPDLSCLIIDAQKGDGKIIAILPLESINPYKVSCFDLNNQPGFAQAYKVVGQFGKSLNNISDLSHPHQMSSIAGQIDVRGYWLDRYAALQVLLTRSSGPYSIDQTTDNYLDDPEYGDKVKSLLSAMMTNEIAVMTQVEWVDGSISQEIVHSDVTSLVKKPIVPRLAEILEVPNGDFSLRTLVPQVMRAHLIDRSHQKVGSETLAMFTVNKGDVRFKAPAGSIELNINGVNVFIQKENVIGRKIADLRASRMVLDKLEPKQVLEIYKLRKENGSLPRNASFEEKAVFKLPMEHLVLFLNGSMEEVSDYEMLLLDMAQDKIRASEAIGEK